jgi:hypothetical protein
MTERYLAIGVAIALFLWLAVTFSGVDVRWFGIAVDGGLLRPGR